MSKGGHILRGTPITAGEKKVQILIVEGHSNESIANQLDICIETVRRHTANIYQKMGVNSRLEMAVEVWRKRYDAAREGKIAVEECARCEQVRALFRPEVSGTEVERSKERTTEAGQR